MVLDGNRLMAITKSGLYEGDIAYTAFQSGQTVVGKTTTTIKKLFTFGDELFALAEDGLYVIVDNAITSVLSDNNINSVRVIENDLFIAVGGNSGKKGIHRYVKDVRSTERTKITNTAAYDIVKHGRDYIVATASGIVHTADTNKPATLVRDSEKTVADDLVSIGDAVYVSDGTKLLKTVVKEDTYELSTRIVGVIAAIRTDMTAFVATDAGIYDQDLNKVYTFQDYITKCRFINMEHSLLDGVYALTDRGVFHCGVNVDQKSQITNLIDVKSTGSHVIKLESDGALYYTTQISKNFWDDGIKWVKIGDGVEQIETIGAVAYFLKGGVIYRQTADSKAFIDQAYDVSEKTLGDFTVTGYYEDSGGLLNGVITYYHNGQNTYGVVSGDTEGTYKSVEMETLTDSTFKDQILKSYSNRKVTPFGNNTSPRMPSVVNGIQLRRLRNCNEVVRVADGGITSIILSSMNILSGEIVTKTSYPEDIKRDSVFQYHDNSRGRGFQDDNYTFFTTNDA